MKGVGELVVYASYGVLRAMEYASGGKCVLKVCGGEE